MDKEITAPRKWTDQIKTTSFKHGEINESHPAQACPGCEKLTEDEEFLQLLEEQNRNIKSFSHILSQAENLLDGITKKVKNSSYKKIKGCLIIEEEFEQPNWLKLAPEEKPKLEPVDIKTSIQASVGVQANSEEDEAPVVYKEDCLKRIEGLQNATEEIRQFKDQEVMVKPTVKDDSCDCEPSPITEGTEMKVTSESQLVIERSKESLLETVDNPKTSETIEKDTERIFNKVILEAVDHKQTHKVESVKVTDQRPQTKQNLVIQKMPSIDIRRGLVTQKIPNIVITDAESLPQLESAEQSNITYEVVKRISNTENKVNEGAKPVQRAKTFEQGEQTDVSKDFVKKEDSVDSVTKILNVKVDRSNQTSKESIKVCSCRVKAQKISEIPYKIETHVNSFIPAVEEKQVVENEKTESAKGSKSTTTDSDSDLNTVDIEEFLAEDTGFDETEQLGKDPKSVVVSQCRCTKQCQVPESILNVAGKSSSEYSSEPSYDYELKKFVSVCKNVRSNVGMLEQNTATTYCNKFYKIESNSEKEMCSKDSKLNPMVEQLAQCQKDHVLKQFISELIKQDPNAEAVLQSYQLLDETSGHEPDEEVIEEQLSNMDEDVYKSFVNPEGLKLVEHMESKETSTEKVLNVNKTTSTTPAAFGFNKDMKDMNPAGDVRVITNKRTETQFEETIQIECDDKVCGICSKSFKPLDTLEKPNTSEKPSVIEDISLKTLSAEKILKPNTSAKPSVIEDISLQTLPSEQILKSPPARLSGEYETNLATNFLNRNSSETTSIYSNNTDDIIFEIGSRMLAKSLSNNLFILDNTILKSATENDKGGTTNGEDDETDLSNIVSQTSDDASEYIITRDVSAQTSLSEVLSVQELTKESLDDHVESLKAIVERDINEEQPQQSCCAKLHWKTKKQNVKDTYKKSSLKPSTEIKQRTMTYSNTLYTQGTPNRISSEYGQRKSVKIEEPELPKTLEPKTMIDNDETVSFISVLTNTSNIAANRVNSFPDRTNSRLRSFPVIDEKLNELQPPDNVKNKGNHPDEIKEEEHNIDNESIKTNDEKPPVTILTVNVEQPGAFVTSCFGHNRNMPRGDGDDYESTNHHHNQYVCKKSNYSPSSVEYKDNRTHRYKRHKKKSSSASTSDATTSDSVTDKTEELLSEGELKHKCNASVGEVHICPCIKNFGSGIDYLKKHPRRLLAHEFGDPHLKIKRQKAYYSNWVAYYVSRSNSPDSENSELSYDSQDSSGLVKK